MTHVFTAWTFNGSETARRAEPALAAASSVRTSPVDDGIHLTWPTAVSSPRSRQLQNTALMEPLGDGFWSVVISALFVLPGLPTPSVVPSLAGIGLSDDFLRQVRAVVTRDTSALMVFSSVDGAEGRSAVLSPWRPILIAETITSSEHEALRSMFCN
jgi:uncharacterized membrane protein